MSQNYHKMRQRAKIIALVVFLFLLIFFSFTNILWPGIMLAVGIPIAILQFFQSRYYDMGITLFVFVGGFATVQFDIQWELILPALFAVGGLYIFFREWTEETRNFKTTELEEQIDEEFDEEHSKGGE